MVSTKGLPGLHREPGRREIEDYFCGIVGSQRVTARLENKEAEPDDWQDMGLTTLTVLVHE